MGNWNRRWVPRRKNHQEVRQSSDFFRQDRPGPESFGVRQSNVPSWEKQFCTLVGSIPWEKVVVAKRYMHFHSDVMKWNDSAGEEAFNNAKNRFWAAINGLPCDIPPPDPNTYIDEIDWNTYIDPELISDLDHAYFIPDQWKNNIKVEAENKKAYGSAFGRAVSQHHDPTHGDNPWESSNLQGIETQQNVPQGWNQWDGSVNQSRNLSNVQNPWERSNKGVDGAMKGNAWGNCGVKSWCWNQGQACNEQSKNCESHWGRGGQTFGSAKGNRWADAGNNSPGWPQWETRVRGSRKFETGDTSRMHTVNQGHGGVKDRGWGDSGDNNWAWNPNSGQKHLDSSRNSGALGVLDGGCRKREGSHQYSSRYKSSKFQGDGYGSSHSWRRGGSQRRVSFA